MKKSTYLFIVVLVLLSLVGCNSTVGDVVNESSKEEQMDVMDSNKSDENTVNGLENEESEEGTGEETDNAEETEAQETTQEPELSDEEKYAALMETGNKYSCFYDENTNTFTYNMEVSGASDFMGFDSFNDLVNSTSLSASSNYEYLGIDCYSNFLDGTIVLYSSLNGQKNDDLTLVRLSPDEAEPTFGQRNALRSAESYLAFSAFSHSKLIQQLEYEGYSNEEATYAADRCGANWCEQAAKSAEAYLKVSAFSQERLIQQLEYEGFSPTQAAYGAAKNGYIG